MSTPAAGRAPVARHDFWRRSLRMWDAVFVGMSTVYVVAVLAESARPADALGQVATMVVLAAAYVLVGRRGARRGDGRLADAYLAVLVVVVVAQVLLGDIGSVLLFLAYTQTWFFARTRVAGVLWCTGMTTALVVATAVRARATGPEVVEIAAELGVALLFAVVVGLWITQVAEQNEERAYLIDELSSAQDALAESHHAAGVLAERARLSAEIHDTLAQGFTSVVMLSQAAGAELERGRTDRAAERLARIEDVARDNLAEARALVAAFAPPDLEGGTLGQALARLGERFGAETGLVVEVADGTAAGPVDREVEVVLLRAVQESLANVRRHAGASRVTLRLAREEDAVVLEVVDDGRGVPPDVREGNGLRGMRARAQATGGSVDVTNGDGTRVRVRIPAAAVAPGGAGAAPAGASVAPAPQEEDA